MSRSERVDPTLTSEGYQQAVHAFTNLISSISTSYHQHNEQRTTLKQQEQQQQRQQPTRRPRVAVFCSSLRRTVGTALMMNVATGIVATNNPPEGTSIEWALPTQQGSTTTCNATGLSPVIPIVISNGLCDCAAQINKMGGHKNALRNGYLNCAAVPSNEECNEQSPIMSEINGMIKSLNRSYLSSDSCNSSIPVQYVKISGLDGKIEPMTPPISISSYSTRPPNEEYSKCGDINVKWTTQKSDVNDFSSIDQVVAWSIYAGLRCMHCRFSPGRDETPSPT